MSTDQEFGTESVHVRVAVYRNEADAIRALENVQSTAARCKQWLNGGVDEYAFEKRQQVSPLDAAADEGFIVRTQTRASGMPDIPAVHSAWVFLRDDDTVTAAYAAWPRGDRGVTGLGDVQRLAETSLARAAG